MRINPNCVALLKKIYQAQAFLLFLANTSVTIVARITSIRSPFSLARLIEAHPCGGSGECEGRDLSKV